ncbi:serpin family protein [Psychrobacter sp. M13]|uniref:serpin family protein n=1 Tax=Psychrobacter sp. M13 TaxID=3067275 RepID=UPI00273CBA35|nr:serpin family protein [Psychrobacter sp. M13]WLP93360.1 serpin family protein [Psychrobacter sp. M13]
MKPAILIYHVITGGVLMMCVGCQPQVLNTVNHPNTTNTAISQAVFLDTEEVNSQQAVKIRDFARSNASIDNASMINIDCHQSTDNRSLNHSSLVTSPSISITQNLDLLKQLNKKSLTKNIVFSTYSLDQAAKTALLSMPKPMTVQRPSWLLSHLTPLSLNQPLSKLPNSYQNNNQLFYHQGYTISPAYDTIYKAALDGTTQPLNFNEPVTAATQANRWVSTQTSGMIDNVFKPDMFIQNDAVLSNVLYFKANWLSPFETDDTKLSSFITASGKTQMVPTMVQELELLYSKYEGWEYVGISFEDGSMLQLFLTPKDKSTAIPDSDTLAALLEESVEKKARLLLPKLNLQGNIIDLNEIAPEINSWQLPNLMLIKVLKNPKLIHQSVITWNETGAKAAALSSIMVSKSLSLPLTVKVNRPFVFMIRHADEVMFTGAVREMDALVTDDKSTL